MPGTYEPWRWGPGGTMVAGRIVRIISVRPTLQVFMSKQRPRKISMLGSDGREYAFLLKGHEDLRQDERVMQLFGLVNCFLLQKRGGQSSHSHSARPSPTASSAARPGASTVQPPTFRYNRSNLANLTVPRYAVVPLSTNSGLLGVQRHRFTILYGTHNLLLILLNRAAFISHSSLSSEHTVEYSTEYSPYTVVALQVGLKSTTRCIR